VTETCKENGVLADGHNFDFEAFKTVAEQNL